jgi:hypothetical protein
MFPKDGLPMSNPAKNIKRQPDLTCLRTVVQELVELLQTEESLLEAKRLLGKLWLNEQQH